MKILVSQKYKIYSGFVYGIRQQSVLIELGITSDNITYSKNLGQLINVLLRKLGFHKKVQITGLTSVLESLAILTIQFQRSQNIPVFTKFKIIKKQSSQNEFNYFLFIPFLNIKAFNLSITCALNILNNLLNAHVEDNEIILSKDIEKFITELNLSISKIYRSGQNYYHLINSCFKLNIPIQDFDQNKIKMGLGFQSNTFKSTITSRTSPIAIELASNKSESTKLLQRAGMPAPLNYQVENSKQLHELASKIGYPVVVKPNDKDRGEGVFANITDQQTLEWCYQNTLNISKNILIEKHYEGSIYRFTLFNDEVIKLTRKTALGIRGDGISSISELLNSLERSIKKRNTKFSCKLIIDEEALGLIKQNGFSLDSILKNNYFLPIKRKNNSSAMGSTEVLDVKESHTDNLKLMSRVSKLFELDIVGIDFIIDEIGKSWLESESAICDVNAMPQSDPRTLEKILKLSIRNSGRIPTFLVVAPTDEFLKQEKQLEFLAKELRCNGYSSKKGIFINKIRVSKEYQSGFHAAKAMVLDRALERGLFLLDYKDILTHGLNLEYLSIIKILKPSKESLIELKQFELILEMIKPHTKILEIL